MTTLDKLLEQKEDPMRKQLQRQMLKVGMTQVANTELETVRIEFAKGRIKQRLFSSFIQLRGKSTKSVSSEDK